MSTSISLLGGLFIIVLAAGVSASLIAVLRPYLRRYALAKPDVRSSHSVPTPQGAGLAVMAIPLVLLIAMAMGSLAGQQAGWPLLLAGSIAMLVLIGAADDMRPLPVWFRLVIQVAAAVLAVVALPESVRILPPVPRWLEFAGLVAGLVWFINLTNFMDGIDGITVIEMCCVLTGIVLVGAITGSPRLAEYSLLLAAMIGALLGFAPFNRHVASLFLGDVGSLPLGALVGWLLIVVAGEGYIVAALLLPLYYLADSSMTLYRRWLSGAPVWQAHRAHAYQVAIARGFRVPEVTNRIFVLNVILILLAIVSVELRSLAVDIAVLTAAAILTAALLRHFERGRNG